MEFKNYKTLIPIFSESFNYGWANMKRDFLRLLLVVLACGVCLIPLGLMDDMEHSGSAGAIILSILGVAYFFMFWPVIDYSGRLMFLQSVRLERIDFKTFVRGFDKYLNIVLANLLVVSLTAIAFVALVIPGIIVACRLAFVPYLVMDKDMDPVDAVEESWRMTRGLGWSIFGMAIVSFFIIIAGIACLVVGVFPAIIWVKSAFAALYQAVLNTKERNGIEVEATE